jgi:hypothetical protein
MDTQFLFIAASEVAIIREAFLEISSKTCITFKQRASEANYVAIQRGAANTGCWSYVGRLGGMYIFLLINQL